MSPHLHVAPKYARWHMEEMEEPETRPVPGSICFKQSYCSVLLPKDGESVVTVEKSTRLPLGLKMRPSLLKPDRLYALSNTACASHSQLAALCAKKIILLGLETLNVIHAICLSEHQQQNLITSSANTIDQHIQYFS